MKSLYIYMIKHSFIIIHLIFIRIVLIDIIHLSLKPIELVSDPFLSFIFLNVFGLILVFNLLSSSRRNTNYLLFAFILSSIPHLKTLYGYYSFGEIFEIEKQLYFYIKYLLMYSLPIIVSLLKNRVTVNDKN